MREYGEKYWLHDPYTPGSGIWFNQILLKGSRNRGIMDTESDEQGFSIDIIRLENLFNNRILRMMHGLLCMAMGFLCSSRAYFKHRAQRLKIAKDNPDKKWTIYFRICVGAVCAVLPMDLWTRMTQTCFGLCKDNDSVYVGFPAGRKHYFGEIYLRDGMVNTIEMPFEGHQWRVARDYDAYLKNLYGNNYMTPPPKERIEHHYVAELQFPEESRWESSD